MFDILRMSNIYIVGYVLFIPDPENQRGRPAGPLPVPGAGPPNHPASHPVAAHHPHRGMMTGPPHRGGAPAQGRERR